MTAACCRHERPLGHRGPDGERTASTDPWDSPASTCGSRAKTTESASAGRGDSGAMLVMDGRLDNRDELISALRLDRASAMRAARWRPTRMGETVSPSD